MHCRRLYLVGGIACVFSRHRQRLGDLAAGTVVVRTPGGAAPDLDQLLGGKYNSLAESRHLAARLRQKVTSGDRAHRPSKRCFAGTSSIRHARLAVFARAWRDYFRTLVPYPPEVAEQLADEPYVRDVVEILYRPSGAASGVTTHRPLRSLTRPGRFSSHSTLVPFSTIPGL